MARTVSASSSSDRGCLCCCWPPPFPPSPPLPLPPSFRASIMAAKRKSKQDSATCFFPLSIAVSGERGQSSLGLRACLAFGGKGREGMEQSEGHSLRRVAYPPAVMPLLGAAPSFVCEDGDGDGDGCERVRSIKRADGAAYTRATEEEASTHRSLTRRRRAASSSSDDAPTTTTTTPIRKPSQSSHLAPIDRPTAPQH